MRAGQRCLDLGQYGLGDTRLEDHEAEVRGRARKRSVRANEKDPVDDSPGVEGLLQVDSTGRAEDAATQNMFERLQHGDQRIDFGVSRSNLLRSR